MVGANGINGNTHRKPLPTQPPQQLRIADSVCDLCMTVLREAAIKGDFRRVDLDDEPPLRVLKHGLPGESVPAEGNAPYIGMIQRDGFWYHGYRCDQDYCDAELHTSDWGRKYFGSGDKAGDAFFRLVIGYAKGSAALTTETPTAKRFVEELEKAMAPAALAVFGVEASEEALARARVYSVYANALLPGHIVNMHLDVPEFAGVDRSGTPNWLLVAAHSSGLFEHLRVYNTTCVFYPRAAVGGELAAYMPIDSAPGSKDRTVQGEVYNVTQGATVVLDTDSCFHHSAQACAAIPDTGRTEIPAPQLPAGCQLTAEQKADGSWEWILVDPATKKEVARYAESEMRWTISCKIHIDGHDAKMTERLDAPRIISTLTEELQRRGTLPPGGAPLPLVDLAPLFVKEFVLPKAPTLAEVQQIWSRAQL